MASLTPSEITYEEAHINDNLSTTLIAICNVFTGIALLSVFARLLARRLARVGRVSLYVAKHPENFERIGKVIIKTLGYSW